jgi:aspartate aminotransferase
MQLSARVSSLKPSSTVAVMNKAAALKAQGVPVLSFGAGEPDFFTPDKAKIAGVRAILNNDTKYQPTAGDVATRELIARVLTEKNGVPGVTKDHVLVTAGVKMALYLTMQALFDPPAPGQAAQEMLLPVPAWVSFAPIAELAGARVVQMPTTTASGFKITPQQLREAINPRTRALLINSPSNPCSTMYTPAELEALAQVIDERARAVAPDLVVIADELYQHIVFGDVPFRSVGSFASIAERVLTVNGSGKSFAMTGWRIGWVSGSGAFGKRFIEAATKLQGQTITAVPGFTMAATRSALTECDEDLDRMKEAFKRRGALMYDLLRAIPGVQVARPIGAFYVFPDVSAHYGKRTPGGVLIDSAAAFAAELLGAHHVAVVPGEDFLGDGHKHIRMSFACDEAQITEGCARLRAFIEGLRGA